MKKYLFIFVFLFGLFAVKSVFANGAFAATVQGTLDNRKGVIDVNVSVVYRDQNGAVQQTPAA